MIGASFLNDQITDTGWNDQLCGRRSCCGRRWRNRRADGSVLMVVQLLLEMLLQNRMLLIVLLLLNVLLLLLLCLLNYTGTAATGCLQLIDMVLLLILNLGLMFLQFQLQLLRNV